MKLFDRFKEWMGIRRLLRDLPQGRKPLPRNLSAARKVAIVYVIEDEAAHNQVRNYVKRIKEDIGITHIMAIGFVDSKIQPHYPVSYTHLRAHETVLDLVCRLLLEKKKPNTHTSNNQLILHQRYTICTQNTWYKSSYISAIARTTTRSLI